MYAPAAALSLSEGQKAEIEALVRSGNTPQKVALRGRLVLLAHQGMPQPCNRSTTESIASYGAGVPRLFCEGRHGGNQGSAEAEAQR